MLDNAANDQSRKEPNECQEPQHSCTFESTALASYSSCLVFYRIDQSTNLQLFYALQTREEIIASREKRRIQLENVLQGIQKKLADHQSGRKPLKKNQLDHLEHKVNAYQHQIEELDRELDEDVRLASSMGTIPLRIDFAHFFFVSTVRPSCVLVPQKEIQRRLEQAAEIRKSKMDQEL